MIDFIGEDFDRLFKVPISQFHVIVLESHFSFNPFKFFKGNALGARLVLVVPCIIVAVKVLINFQLSNDSSSCIKFLYKFAIEGLELVSI